ncbi:putative sensor-like histidine kinase [compost metagenome]
MGLKHVLLNLRNMRLQRKLLMGYLLASVFPFLIVSVIIYRQAASGLEQSSQEFASLYTSQIESSLNEFMKEYDRVTKSVLVDNDIIDKLGETQEQSMEEQISQLMTVRRLLMRVVLLKPEASNLMLISRDNTVYQYSNTNTTRTVKEAELLAQDWHNRVKESGEVLFVSGLHSRSYYEDKNEGTIVTIGRVLLSSQGAYAGVLLIDLDPSKFMELNPDFVSARDKYGMSVVISTNQGETIYHSDAASGRIPWKQVVESGIDYTKDRSSGDMIVLTGSTQLGKLIIKTEIPRQKLLLKINKIKFVTVIVIVVGWLIMSIISIAVSYRITKPIKALRKSMKQAENGHYFPIENVKEVNDEIGSLVYSYNRMIVTIRTLIEDVYIGEIKHRRAKFLALQNQINPHMLYNTLESIRMKALVKGDQEVSDMIKILARMFRLALRKDGNVHTIQHELDYTINYLQLQNIRYDNFFNLHIQIPESMLGCNVIPLVFQPIVENSIIHGFQDYSQRMNILIEGEWTEHNGIKIRISDDGCGMPEEKLEEIKALLEDANSDKYKLDQTNELIGKGLGLKNIAERIKLQYGDPYYLTLLSSGDHGTTIEIHIPNS